MKYKEMVEQFHSVNHCRICGVGPIHFDKNICNECLDIIEENPESFKKKVLQIKKLKKL